MKVVPLVLAFGLCLLYTCEGASSDERLLFKKIQPQRKFRDCHERWKENKEVQPGVYTIYPNGTHSVEVYCKHSVNATATVIQQRVSNVVSFIQPWHVYKAGFGHPALNYWIGLDNIYHLTNTGSNVLRIDMLDWSGNRRYAQYQYFHVNSEVYWYQMTVSGFSGNVIDDLSSQSGMYFYTYDRPDQNQCATNQGAGWWYHYCAYTLLNGKYYLGGPYSPSGQFYDGIYWKDWLGYGYSLKSVTMSLYR